MKKLKMIIKNKNHNLKGIFINVDFLVLFDDEFDYISLRKNMFEKGYDPRNIYVGGSKLLEEKFDLILETVFLEKIYRKITEEIKNTEKEIYKLENLEKRNIFHYSKINDKEFEIKKYKELLRAIKRTIS